MPLAIACCTDSLVTCATTTLGNRYSISLKRATRAICSSESERNSTRTSQYGHEAWIQGAPHNPKKQNISIKLTWHHDIYVCLQTNEMSANQWRSNDFFSSTTKEENATINQIYKRTWVYNQTILFLHIRLELLLLPHTHLCKRTHGSWFPPRWNQRLLFPGKESLQKERRRRMMKGWQWLLQPELWPV